MGGACGTHETGEKYMQDCTRPEGRT